MLSENGDKTIQFAFLVRVFHVHAQKRRKKKQTKVKWRRIDYVQRLKQQQLEAESDKLDSKGPDFNVDSQDKMTQLSTELFYIASNML